MKGFGIFYSLDIERLSYLQKSKALFNHEFEKKVFGWYSVLRHKQSTIKLEPFEYEWEGGIISSKTPLGQNYRPTLKPKND